MPSDAYFSTAPYPGLRPFETEEQDIFFGREAQTDQLLKKLQAGRFLAIVGPSGCGKSSLVRAGLIACLETGLLASAGSRWRIVTLRPGRSPIGRLARRLAANENGNPSSVQEQSSLSIEAALRRGPLGLVDCVRESAPSSNLLLLVDQFEELFRFRAEQSADEADAFVDLMLATARQREVPIYVVLTMRSDFLGQCALFHGLPEAISESQYLTPRLTRDECAQAIAGPARVFGGEVEPALVHRLLNDIGPDADQLPVMQHALMRMWSLRRMHQPEGRIVLTVEGYEAIGGLSRALSRHADEALFDLPERGQALARMLFQRISSRTDGQLDTRAPAPAGDIASVADATIAEIAAVADAFRRPDRSFLTPPAGEPIEQETFLDVSHESLIAHWDRLSGWVREEAESAMVYARLKREAILWHAGEAALWGSPNLERALDWKQKARPTSAWAERYGSASDFDLAMQFLAASEAKRRDEQTRVETARKRELRRARWVAGLSALVAASLVVGMLVFGYLWVWCPPTYFDSFVMIREVPHGVDPLTPAQVSRRLRSCRVTTKGRWGPVLRVETVDATGKLTPGIITFLDRNPGPDDIAASWEYAYDNRDRLIGSVAYDEHHVRLGGLQYVRSSTPDATTTIYKVGRDGTPDPKAPLIRVQFSSQGYAGVLRYRDRSDAPVPGQNGAFGFRREFDKAGHTTTWTWLDAEDKPMNGANGIATMKYSFDASGRDVLEEALDAAGSPTLTKAGWAAVKKTYDRYGNVLSESYFDVAGRPTIAGDGFHRVAYTLDDRGHVIVEAFESESLKPITNTSGCYGLRTRVDDRGNSIESTCVGADGKTARDNQGIAIRQMDYDDHHHLVERVTRDPDGREAVGNEGFSRLRHRYDDGGHLTHEEYAGPDGRLVPCSKGYARLRSVNDSEGRVLSHEYFSSDGKPTTSEDGYAKITYKYDEAGNTIEERYLGIDGTPALNALGSAGYTARYDAQGHAFEHELMGIRGERTLGKGMYAGWRSSFDHGDEIERSYFGLTGEPILTADGVAGWQSTFDARHNELSRRYFDTKHDPAVRKDGYSGWVAAYDVRGSRTETRYIDATSAPALFRWRDARPDQGYARVVDGFDASGNPVEESYFGLNGELVSGEKGFARVGLVYDERRHEIERAYYGPGGGPTMVDGFHLARSTNDEHGNRLEIAFFDLDGNPAVLTRGFSRLVRRYDAYGRVVEEQGFKGGEPVRLERGCWVLGNAYDVQGHKVAFECRSLDGALERDANGVAVIRYAYDTRGRKVETSFHGVNDELVTGKKEGYAVRKNGYDERGSEVGVELLDAQRGRVASAGQPAHLTPK